MFFAGACVALSGAGHAVMAGTTPPWWSLGLAFGLVAAGVYAATGKRRSQDAILAGVWLGQLGLHALFAWASPTGGPVAVAHGQMAMSGTSSAGPGMVAAHAFAGLVTAWCLHRGETALWAALSTLLRWFHAVAPPRQVTCPEAYEPRIGVWAVAARDVPVAVAVLRHVLARRGPPRQGDRGRGRAARPAVFSVAH